MPYTSVSLVLAWLMAAVLVGVTAFGEFSGRAVVVIALLALAGPALLLRRSVPPKSA